jgi:hypothetical protein
MENNKKHRLKDSIIGGIVCFILESVYWIFLLIDLLFFGAIINLGFILGWSGYFILFFITSGYFGYSVGYKSVKYILLSICFALLAGFLPLIIRFVFNYFPGW